MSNDFDFNSRYPIPFRILFLSFTTLFGFATNLHLLAYLGIDTALVLDVRSAAHHSHSNVPSQHVHPLRLFGPIYVLALVGLGWTVGGWMVFSSVTGGDETKMREWRAIPCFVVLGVVGGLIVPWNILCRRERGMFMRSLKRTIFSGLYSPVPFCDIILADILTSFAKVLGDVWVAGCLLFTALDDELGDDERVYARIWMVPIMTSLPYIFRFRQCLSEVLTGSTPTPRKSLLNALKYASAFPVIILSAMQTVTGDPFDESEEIIGDVWIGRNALFTLWIMAVLANSLFSFWWDVTNDWGLSLLTSNGWSSSSTTSYAFPSITPKQVYARARGGSASLLNLPDSKPSSIAPPPSRPQSPGRMHSHAPRPGHTRAYSTAATPNVSFPFLRPILLLPDPTIYYLAIAIDLVLRFTWSIKLSSHLHTINEIESGIFMMEALEVLRRWMWVYLRIEWEAVRKGGGSNISAEELRGRVERAEDLGVKEEIGLGILVMNE